jgi:uncharacterized Zn-finger protein
MSLPDVSDVSAVLPQMAVPAQGKKRTNSDGGKATIKKRERLTHKDFVDSSDLARHNKLHTGDKPHTCPTCDKRFARSSNLSQHKRIHTGNKPHRCPTCDKRFARSSNLSQHKPIHTGNKPHKCPTCGKRFARSFSLSRRKKRHTSERPSKLTQSNASQGIRPETPQASEAVPITPFFTLILNPT